MFGKPIAEYLAFQKWVLVVLAAVGLLRLALSAAGMSNDAVKWLSLNLVTWVAVFYYGITVHTRRFGSYKQLLPLMLFHMAVFQGIAVLGILLAMAGVDNIFAAPEYSFGAQSQAVHLLAHLTIGMVVPVLMLWGVASLVLLVTRKLAPRPALTQGA